MDVYQHAMMQKWDKQGQVSTARISPGNRDVQSTQFKSKLL